MAIYSLANRTSNTTTANACLEIIASSSVGYRLLELGIVAKPVTPSEMAKLVDLERLKWKKVIEAAGIKPE